VTQGHAPTLPSRDAADHLALVQPHSPGAPSIDAQPAEQGQPQAQPHGPHLAAASSGFASGTESGAGAGGFIALPAPPTPHRGVPSGTVTLPVSAWARWRFRGVKAPRGKRPLSCDRREAPASSGKGQSRGVAGAVAPGLQFGIFPVAFVPRERTESAFVSRFAGGLPGGAGRSFLAWAMAAALPSDPSRRARWPFPPALRLPWASFPSPGVGTLPARPDPWSPPASPTRSGALGVRKAGCTRSGAGRRWGLCRCGTASSPSWGVLSPVPCALALTGSWHHSSKRVRAASPQPHAWLGTGDPRPGAGGCGGDQGLPLLCGRWGGMEEGCWLPSGLMAAWC